MFWYNKLEIDIILSIGSKTRNRSDYENRNFVVNDTSSSDLFTLS